MEYIILSTIYFNKYVYNFSLFTECDACKKMMVMGYNHKYTEICDHCYLKYEDVVMDIKHNDLSVEKYMYNTHIYYSIVNINIIC
jgi:hypothetical protein